MIYEMSMPSLGADMDEAKFIEWRVKPGDKVKKGQTVAEIETQKAAVEIESFHDGVVKKLLAEPGQTIKVGKPIAQFDLENNVTIAPATSLDVLANLQQPKIRISPAARKFAEEHHINLNTAQIKELKGTGPEGAIELSDLQKVENIKPEESFLNIRDAIAKAMKRSKMTIPHYYLKLEINVDKILQFIETQNSKLEPLERWLFPAVIGYSVSKVLANFAQFNGYNVDEKYTASASINLGFAISLKTGGVLVPALLNCETRNIKQFNFDFKDLVERTRESKLKGRELTEGTFTITNLGELGADEVYGIIFPPQVALLGIGRLQKKAGVQNNSIVIQNVVTITLSADHRVSDGLTGSKFLNAISNLLSEPEKLFAEKIG